MNVLRWIAVFSFLLVGASAYIAALTPGVAGASTPSTPRAVKLPDSSDAGPVPDAVANDISCRAAGSCTAVGDYDDTIGITHAETFNLSSGTWTAEQQLAPTGPPDYTFSDLNAVSCISVGNCVAVGDYRVSTVQTESFYAVETSGVWARGQELPVPADADTDPAETSFDSISCLPGGVCQFMGIYAVTPTPLASPIHAVVDTYDFGSGLKGSPVEISQLSGQEGIDLNSISCTADGVGGPYCVAVGSQVGKVSEEATYDVETNGVWSPAVVLRNPHDGSIPAEFLSSVSCTSTGDCVAAGNYLDNFARDFVETYKQQGGVWGPAVDVAQPFNTSNPFVDDLSCVSITSCTMVGAIADAQGTLHAATAQMTGGRWGQLATAGAPAGAIPDEELLGVSCTTGISCSAVGYYNVNTSTGGTEAMGATWTPGVPPGAVSNLRVAATTKVTARLTWDAPSSVGTGISHYELTTDLAGTAPVDGGPLHGTSGTATHLHPGGTYHLSVTTVATDGQASRPVTVIVRLPATVPSAPSIVRVVGVSRGLFVSWRAPRETGGAPITTYRVSARCGATMRTSRVSGSSRHGLVSNLPAGVRCSVTVAAVNRVGTGPRSPARTGATRG